MPQKQKQSQKQSVHIHINDAKPAKPKRKYTKRSTNTKTRRQPQLLDSQSGNGSALSRTSINPPILPQADTTTTALLTSILSHSLNNSQMNNSQMNQSSFLPSRNDTTNDKSYFKARESFIPTIPETPIHIKPETVQQTEIKSKPPPPPPPPPKSVIQQVKPVSKPDPNASGFDAVMQELKYKTSEEGKAEAARKKEAKKQQQSQSTLDFIFGGGTPIKQARPSSIHQFPTPKKQLYLTHQNPANAQAAVKRLLTPTIMDKQFGDEMRKNIKAHQSLISEDKTRTKQPENKVNHAQAAIDYYSRNIIKKKVGRPKLDIEPVNEQFSLFD